MAEIDNLLERSALNFRDQREVLADIPKKRKESAMQDLLLVGVERLGIVAGRRPSREPHRPPMPGVHMRRECPPRFSWRVGDSRICGRPASPRGSSRRSC